MIQNDQTRGVIFSIQPYSIHNGPGIRTTVFLKGCPLRCLWCQNIESQIMTPQIIFDETKCTGCRKCQAVCPQQAITMYQDHSWTDRNKCQGCGRCSSVCTIEARNLTG
jgi:pyruvate formate lyase activating enzyme